MSWSVAQSENNLFAIPKNLIFQCVTEKLTCRNPQVSDKSDVLSRKRIVATVTKLAYSVSRVAFFNLTVQTKAPAHTDNLSRGLTFYFYP